MEPTTVDTTRTPRTPPGLSGSAPRLKIHCAHDPALVAESSTPVLLIGSRRDCQISLQNNEVSAVHCAVVNTGRDIVVLDLCSRTGISVNDQAVQVARLFAGDVLSVGGVRCQVSGESAAGDEARSRDIAELDCPLRLAVNGETRELKRLPAVVGRRKACHVMVDTPDVSLAHALLFTIDGRPVVFDVGSRSGTFVNQERIDVAWLADGDVIDIGGEKLTVNWSGPVGPAPAPSCDGDAAVENALRTPAGKVLLDFTAVHPAHAGTCSAELSELRTLFVAAAQRLAGIHERIARHAAELMQRESEVAQREAGFSERQNAQDRRATEQDELQRSLDARAAELARAQEEIAASKRALDERRAGIEQREAAVAGVEADLAERARQLAAREQLEQQTAAQIEHFRRMLADVSSTLNSGNTDAGAQAGAFVAERLPAPLIQKPIFPRGPASLAG
jgi:pSer/pThr/pTyr-binding forkhead associated (FHA) protein